MRGTKSNRMKGENSQGPRLKPSTTRAHGLDTLRSLAIFSVIVFHVYAFHTEGTLPGYLVPAARMGWMGVDLFFVLSGYLIASQLLRPYLAGERPGLWEFYRNRLYRVLPAYLVVLALYFTIPVWTEDPALSPIWQFLTFTLNLFINYQVDQGFSHAWSLCVEEHFYLFLPLIVLAMMRKPSFRKTAALIGGLVIFGICLRSFILFHTLRPLAKAGQPWGLVYIERIYYPTYSRLDGLLAGVTLALIKNFRPRWWSAFAKRGHTLGCVGVCLVGVAIWLFKDRWVSVSGVSALGTAVGFPVLSLGLGLLVASALSTNGLLSRCKVPGAKLIATLAYSLYLTHKELIHLVDLCFPALFKTGGGLWLGVYAAVCLLVAGVLYLCVERPFFVLRDRHRRGMASLEGAEKVRT
jgi:peptidoglycan/LPS O-acetylase OafA/YrhL